MGVIEATSRLEVIPAVGCERHLRQESVGRLAVNVGDHPEIFPVNYAVDDAGRVVFRTDHGTKLSALVQDARVAFEIDGIDTERRVGWSVLVTGTATWVGSAGEIAALRQLTLEPWAVGEKSHYVRISPLRMSGRQIPMSVTPVGLRPTPIDARRAGARAVVPQRLLRSHFGTEG